MTQQARRNRTTDVQPVTGATPVRAERNGRGNAFRQEQLNGANTPPAGTDAAAPTASPRQTAIDAYKVRLTAVAGEIALIEDAAEKQRSARAVLAQAVDVLAQIDAGQTVDVEALPRIPEGNGGAYPSKAFPTEWIPATRSILQHAGGSGAAPPTRGEDAATWDANGQSGSVPIYEQLLRAGREGADYGVNGYQTQSNNLASPEATCNVTSMAMVLERLGYSRQDLIDAIEVHLKKKQEEARLRAEGLSSAEVATRMQEFEPACVALATDAWKNRVLEYLRDENGSNRESNYQKLRGAAQTDKQLNTWAGEFKQNAGMDDLVHFMLDILGLERTAINADGNPGKVIDFASQGTNRAKPTSERIDAGGRNTWATTKPRIKEVLDQGGAAMISVRHKGAGQSGTHIVAIQAVESGGIRVDDPFGTMRTDYDAGERGDAYSTNGGGTRDRDRKNQVQADASDWHMSAPLNANEVKGESNVWSDATVESAWFYVTLFRRGQAAAPAAATPGPAGGPQPEAATTAN